MIKEILGGLSLNYWKKFEIFILLAIIADIIFLIFTGHLKLWSFGTWALLLLSYSSLLNSKKTIATYIFGTVGTLFYLMVVWQEGLLGDIPIQIYFIITNIWGFILWHRVDDEDGNIHAEKITKKWAIIGITLIPVITIIYGSFVGMVQNELIYLISFVTACQIMAKIFMMKRFQEQYYFWILADSIYVLIWFIVGDPAMISLYMIYVVTSIYGYYNYHRDLID